MMGIFNGNGAESSNSSVAYVAAGGKALFYSTRAFYASQGTLFEVEGSGTLLLDGGVFPRGDGASFGKFAFGALFLLRNLPKYSPSDSQIVASDGGGVTKAPQMYRVCAQRAQSRRTGGRF